MAGAAGFAVAAPVLLLIIGAAHSARVGLMAMLKNAGFDKVGLKTEPAPNQITGKNKGK